MEKEKIKSKLGEFFLTDRAAAGYFLQTPQEPPCFAQCLQ